MSKLNWSKAGLGNPDPARVIDVGDFGAYDEVKPKPVRRPGRTRAEIAAVDRAEEIRAHKAALKKYGRLPVRSSTLDASDKLLIKRKKSDKAEKTINRPVSSAAKVPSGTQDVFSWQGTHVDLVRSMWGRGYRARSIAKLIEGATKADVLRLAVFLGLSMNDLPVKDSG